MEWFRRFSVDEPLVARVYRWWTVRSCPGALKLGPLTVGWYRWFDGRWRVEVIALCRYRLFLSRALDESPDVRSGPNVR